MTINQLFSSESTDVRSRRGAPWGRSDRPCPSQGAELCCHFLPAQARGEFQGAAPSHTCRLEVHRGIQVLLTYPWVFEVAPDCWWFFMDFLCYLRLSPFHLLHCRQW